MQIRIDPDEDKFLLDHVVGGAPLLPTVMQLDLAARGLKAGSAGRPAAVATAGVLLRDVVVGPPVRFDRPGPRVLQLACTPLGPVGPGRDAVRCELRTPETGAAHMTATAEHTPVPAARTLPPSGWVREWACGSDLVYPPFFHGPSFRVVAGFARAGTGLAAGLAPDLPQLGWASGPAMLRPHLLELLLQCCGLQELARTGLMMVPAAIEAVHWHPAALAAGLPVAALAYAVPRPGSRGRVFDGQVAAADGTVLVTVTGYRTTDLGRPPDPAHAARLRLCLDPGSPPASTTDAIVSEGLSR